MTIKEYCKTNEKCDLCLLNGLCKGTDREKYKPEDYSYSDDMYTTSHLLILAEILKQ